MAEVNVTTEVSVKVETTVSVEKFIADLICFDDKFDRLAVSVRMYDQDVVPEQLLATKLVVISGQSYLDLLSQNPIGSQTFGWNLRKAAEMILQDVAGGAVPPGDVKIIDVDFYAVLQSLS